jgi:hypothetical protein
VTKQEGEQAGNPHYLEERRSKCLLLALIFLIVDEMSRGVLCGFYEAHAA